MSLSKASHMPAGVVLMMIGVSDWRGAVDVLVVVMCQCCMYMYTLSLSHVNSHVYIYIAFHSLIHAYMYINNACNSISVHQ